MSPLHSLILGLVEGFTEFLPISSTAHLILTSHILGLGQTAFVKTFEIAIQSGAILAVIIVYWRKFLDIEILKKVIVAFIPTAIIGLALYKTIKTYLIGDIYVVLWALGIGGVLLIVFELFLKLKPKKSAEDSTANSGDNSAGNLSENLVANSTTNSPTNSLENSNQSEIKSLSYTKAALIGVAQAIAIIPGVSRSAATIVGGMLVGMNRVAVVEFSFLLAAPTIAAATLLDLYQNADAFTADQTVSLIIGFMAALVTALIGIKFLLSFVKSKTFVGFGVYRVLLVIVFLAFFI